MANIIYNDYILKLLNLTSSVVFVLHLDEWITEPFEFLKSDPALWRKLHLKMPKNGHF